jgi:hypothetical protein
MTVTKATVRRKLLGPRLLDEAQEWPLLWQGLPDDVRIGKTVVAAIRPFLASLAASDASETTLRRHFGNAYLLGDEIVRNTSLLGIEVTKGTELLLEFIDESGGPLLHGYATEDEQRSFDSTCRKLHRFVVGETRETET